MSEVTTENTRILQSLDWKFEPPCEMAYARREEVEPTVFCDEAATVWLTYVNRFGRTGRRLACAGCVGRMTAVGRMIEVRTL